MIKKIRCWIQISAAFFLLDCYCFGVVPKISIITSVYKSDAFIRGFLEDIVQQTIFNQCELILINAASPGNEAKVIREFMVRYPNIIYKKLKKDPGLYGVWNIAIKMAQGEYLTNANTDDRLKFDCYEKHTQMLDQHPEIDLVYSENYVTYVPNETFEKHTMSRVYGLAEFSRQAMRGCLPSNHPMWRKTFHQKYGYFDSTFKIYGDYEMWLRAVDKGSMFKKVPGVYGIYYFNPNGLSTKRDRQRRRQKNTERKRILKKYQHIWQ